MTSKKAWESKDTETLKKYNALDCIATMRAYAPMLCELRTDRQRNLYSHNKALSQLAAKMHDVGFKIHKENREFLAWGLEVEWQEKMEALKSLVKIPAFEGTENQMRSLVWKRHANKDIARFNLADPLDERMWNDDKTQIKVDYNTLLMIVTNPGQPQELKDIINAYWGAVEVWKLRSTFVVSQFIDQAIGEDGRLRAGWNSLGADTGRPTCSKPNILNIKQFIRDMYCADDGKVLVHADFSQQELWVMAAVAGDKQLFKNLGTGDVYTEDAKDWFGLPATVTKKTMKPEIRKCAKVNHLARQYGAGDKTAFMQILADVRNMTWTQNAILGKKFQQTYCDTVAYWDDEMKRIAKNGYAHSRIMERRKVFPRMPERSQAVNFPIQSTAADISNLSLLEVDRRLIDIKGTNIVHQFYDAMDVECYESDVDKVTELLTDVMCRPRKVGEYSLAIPIEVKVGKCWGEV